MRREVVVDGHRFHIHLEGEEGPLGVESSTGAYVHLARWRLEDHLWALDRFVRFAGRGMEFDHDGFSRALLRRSGVPEELFEELAPIALWWAVGAGSVEAPGSSPEGWVRTGAVQAWLRSWTFAERSKALEASLTLYSDGVRHFSLERYLSTMLTTCVVALEPSDRPWRELDGASATALLDAVVTLNTSGDCEEDRLLEEGNPGIRALARTLLRLCRALGWTPSRVWATPASEIHRLLALLDAVEADAPPAAPHPEGLAAHPDAVVIQVEER
ncbi:hypothetical protein [Corallococcus llansteffanensis]|uniref:Uncharacterized protein n=1 Tax=Corallococcus llansteffanensis TaxID=2316731 RepID=A0A3A8QKI1_9BACT|nr:hypothetical protein [Corallococcus llansteffanensis]RKH68281.1 hypothetical protein D7V93_01565 [Corallococcus llansteffanensis]